LSLEVVHDWLKLPKRIIAHRIFKHRDRQSIDKDEVVLGEMEVNSVPCGHSDLFRDSHVKTLDRKLATCLTGT